MPSEIESLRRWLRDIDLHIVKVESFVAALDYEGYLRGDLRLFMP